MIDEQDRVAPEDRVDELAQDDQADEREDADREAEDELAADPLAEDALDGRRTTQHVEPPRGRQRRVERRRQRDPVLQQVEHQDRQDEVGEERAEEAPGAGDERQQEGQVEPPPGLPPPADARR